MNLTKKQVQFLEYIENFINQYGYSPTYREIASGLGYKSVATVAKHIDNLIILGKLEKSDNAEARSLSIKRQSRNENKDDKLVLDYLKTKMDEFNKKGDMEKALAIRIAINELFFNK